MTESVQKWLERNRPPRVKITYEVQTGGAIEKRELPFIIGVLADLTGKSRNHLPKLSARQMLPIDRDTFNEVLRDQRPRIDLTKVKRTLPKKATTSTENLTGSLHFGALEDFEPLNVVDGIDELSDLYSVRGHLRMLESRAESSDELAATLDDLCRLTPEASEKRRTLRVLADSNGAARTELALQEARMSLFGLALALAKTEAQVKAAALNEWGFSTKQAVKDSADVAKADSADVAKADSSKAVKDGTATPPETPPLLRQFLDLFASDVDEDATAQAVQQLRAMTDDSSSAAAVDMRDRQKKMLGVVDAATKDNAKALLATLIAGRRDKNGEDSVGYAESHLAGRILLGLLEDDDESAIRGQTDDISARERAERKHAAANRSVAIGMLLQLRAASKADRDPTKASAAADSAAAKFWANMAANQPMLQAAQLPTDSTPLNVLASLGCFVRQVLVPIEDAGPAAKEQRAANAITACVERIDKAISEQLNEVMHCADFRSLEATWRGLHYLVSRAETGPMLKLRVLNATAEELLNDLESAVDKDQSHLFKLIYEAEFGTYGGDPYSLLIGGYEIGRAPTDIAFLNKMSQIAASAHAPFICAASPALFGLQSFRSLDRPRDLSKIFESADTAGWREFRESEDSRYVTLVLPHVLLRLPYGTDTWPARGLKFEEDVGDPNTDHFLWGNASFMLAERIAHAFSVYNWTAAIRGVEGGGLVQGLPLYTYRTAAGTEALFCPTEISITDRREKELNDLGFISLCHCKGKGEAAFFGGQTVNLPKKYIRDDANANARISAMLPYMLAASRFAHYIKVIMRAKVGSFLTRANVESYLNSWIAQYVLLDENAMQEAKASYPLSQASVVVADVPGEPGSYKAVVFLRPHFQLEELTTSIRLVADLPAA